MPKNYKGYIIEQFGRGYTIFYNGDEIYFKTIKKAKKFIDEIINDKKEERYE